MAHADADFVDFYDREFRAVFHAVFLLTRNVSAAEEATQEAFVRALERWARLRGATWAGGWVTTTAVNLAKRGLRRRPVPETPPVAGPDDDEVIDLWRAVAALPRKQRDAVVLVYRVGLTNDEAARALGIAPGALRVNLTRARQALQRQLDERGREGNVGRGSAHVAARADTALGS